MTETTMHGTQRGAADLPAKRADWPETTAEMMMMHEDDSYTAANYHKDDGLDYPMDQENHPDNTNYAVTVTHAEDAPWDGQDDVAAMEDDPPHDAPTLTAAETQVWHAYVEATQDWQGHVVAPDDTDAACWLARRVTQDCFDVVVDWNAQHQHLLESGNVAYLSSTILRNAQRRAHLAQSIEAARRSTQSTLERLWQQVVAATTTSQDNHQNASPAQEDDHHQHERMEPNTLVHDDDPTDSSYRQVWETCAATTPPDAHDRWHLLQALVQARAEAQQEWSQALDDAHAQLSSVTLVPTLDCGAHVPEHLSHLVERRQSNQGRRQSLQAAIEDQAAQQAALYESLWHRVNPPETATLTDKAMG